MAISAVCAVIYSLVFVLVYFSSLKESVNGKLQEKNAKSYMPFYITLIAVFVVQLISTQFSIGFTSDTGLFRSWTSYGEKYHIWEYYTTEKYVDYPPAYLTVLFVVGKIAAFFGVDKQSDLYLCFIRFVPIMFDAICSVFIFRFAKDKIGDKPAMTIALLSAFNPVNIYNSTVYGQVDSIVVMLVCGVLVFLYKKKYIPAAALFMLSILTKPQLIIYAPLVGFTVLSDFFEVVHNKEERTKFLKTAGLAILAAILVFVIVPIPATGGNYTLLFENYKKALGMYQYATLNAPNLYGAFGGNWAKNHKIFLLFSYKTWGFIFIVAMSVLVGIVSFKAKNRSKIYYLGAFTVSTIFLFAHGMHERYIHALFMVLLIIYVIKKDPKVLFLYLGFSMSSLLNCTQVVLKNHAKDFIYGDNTFFILNSWFNLVLYAIMVYIFYKALFKENDEKAPLQKTVAKKKKTNLPKTKKTVKPFAEVKIQKPYEHIPFVKKDYLIMAIFTVVYSVVAFWNLGSANTPQNGWYPESKEESVTVDLGKECDIERIYINSGWIDRHTESRKIERILKVEASADGESFEHLTDAEINKVFSWRVFENPTKTRYIRLTPDDDRFYLNEIAFFGKSEEEKFIPSDVISENETAKYLIDEQDRVKYEFSWFDGPYFDEIYHPRTAYEYITDRKPYENTHPPLGKVIISWGIMIFGMNPFGWRFFGTLCGVLMVPLSYMFGKKLFKKTMWASLACLMFTFDFMHLSQTRLATIDSFTTFFVMGMYYFMYLFASRSFYNESFSKVCLPLLGSGICFGLGAATKWQGIYAGLGLCVIFFAVLIIRYIEFKTAKEGLSASKGKSADEIKRFKSITESFKPCAVKMIVCGVVFFVIIPALIYTLSYVPTMNNEGMGISYMLKNQETMLSYHSTIEGKHPYMSEWWQWPIDQKPLYASSPNRMFVPEGTAMGITSFGNPLVWWLTIPSVIGALWLLIKKRRNDVGLWTVLMGFLAMYMPWMLVSRSSFIYHFFPCVIFVVMMAVALIKNWYEAKPQKSRAAAIGVYSITVVVLFAMFYPVLTGMPVPEAYANALEWLPGWVLG